jgi:hypothetical protein
MNHDLFLFFTAWYAGNHVRKALQTIAQNDRANRTKSDETGIRKANY